MWGAERSPAGELRQSLPWCYGADRYAVDLLKVLTPSAVPFVSCCRSRACRRVGHRRRNRRSKWDRSPKPEASAIDDAQMREGRILSMAWARWSRHPVMRR